MQEHQNKSPSWIIIPIIIIIAVALWMLFGQNKITPPPITQNTPTTNNNTINTSGWKTYTDTKAGFSILYPILAELSTTQSVSSTTSWRTNSNDIRGSIIFSLTLPKSFEPKTNFSEGKLTVGTSTNLQALSDCLTQDPTGGTQTGQSTKVIHGISFTIFHMSDAGAGNYYETTSYRTIRNMQCIAIEYTVHSTQLMNYPESAGIHEFDKIKINNLLDAITKTFTLQ